MNLYLKYMTRFPLQGLLTHLADTGNDSSWWLWATSLKNKSIISLLTLWEFPLLTSVLLILMTAKSKWLHDHTPCFYLRWFECAIWSLLAGLGKMHLQTWGQPVLCTPSYSPCWSKSVCPGAFLNRHHAHCLYSEPISKGLNVIVIIIWSFHSLTVFTSCT